MQNSFNPLQRNIIMDNIEGNDSHSNRLIGKTIKDIDNNSTALVIPKEYVKELDIENSKISMSLLDDFSGNRYLIVTKYYNEIVMD